jgi:glycosyltransferase involved in cell wall biosynthesis
MVLGGADLYGASRCALRLARRLRRDGHRVVAVMPHDGPLRGELERGRVEVLIHPDLPVISRQRLRGRVGWAGLLRDCATSVPRLYRVTRAVRPHVIHTNTALILSPGVTARIAGVPHVWHVREFFGEFRGWWRWYQRFMARFADVLVCVSRAVADQYDWPPARDRAIVVHDGMPREEFSDIGPERVEAFRRQIGVTTEPLVGLVGRIKLVRKGQDVLVRAAARLTERFPEARFVIIGSPFPGNESHLDDLHRLVKELGVEAQVVYVGEAADIKAAEAALDVLVLPSGLPEPFGGVVLEAMALGKPVVATRHGGTCEQVEDGVTGFLVPPGDAVAHAEAIGRLLADAELRRAMGERGRERFLRLFELERHHARMVETFRSLAAGGRRSGRPRSGVRA